MRAREFITERKGKPKKRHASVQKSVRVSRDVGGYDRMYHGYRLWMATAKADGKNHRPVDMDEASWLEKYNSQHPYTKEEYNMFRQAEATVPTDGHDVIPWSKSQEPDDTHKTSPVSNWNQPKKKKKKKK